MENIKELYATTTANYTEVQPDTFTATLGEYQSKIIHEEGEWLIQDGNDVYACPSFEKAVYWESMTAISHYIQKKSHIEGLIEFFEEGELLRYANPKKLLDHADLVVCKTAEAARMFAWLCDCEDVYLRDASQIHKALVPMVFAMNDNSWNRVIKSAETLVLRGYGL